MCIANNLMCIVNTQVFELQKIQTATTGDEPVLHSNYNLITETNAETDTLIYTFEGNEYHLPWVLNTRNDCETREDGVHIRRRIQTPLCKEGI